MSGKKKKKPKRKYNPNKNKKPPPPAAHPMTQRMELINRMKPIMDAAARVQARQRERATQAAQDEGSD